MKGIDRFEGGYEVNGILLEYLFWRFKKRLLLSQ